MESGNEQYDITSLEILNKCHLDLFPKNVPIYDEYDSDYYKDIESKLLLLCGEYVQYMGKSGKLNEDYIVLTNYRLFILLNNETSFINIPIMLIEYVEIKEIVYIYVYFKNVKTVKLIFSTNEKCLLWYQRLISIATKITKLDDLFAFRFYSWYINDKSDESSLKLDFDKFDPRGLLKQEYDRMEFDNSKWRISRANTGHKICPTYPEFLIEPKHITDDQLQKAAGFRSSRRFPTVVWKSKVNGCIIARSSQPNFGLLAGRLTEDELLIKAIANNCYDFSNSNKDTHSNNTNTEQTLQQQQPKPETEPEPESEQQQLQAEKQTETETQREPEKQEEDGVLLVIDARCRSVALANRIKGGGHECCEFYTNCEIQFMNLPNIHVVRSSFQSLRLVCQTIKGNKHFYSQLELTKWLHYLSGIIKAARIVVTSIDRHANPVLIHCSDGWDRTPQIICLSKLLLDPYYRTIKGFQILIEFDWLMYGHQFAKRNGHKVNFTDNNERCPVFLQWLDCVYQMLKQYPSAFEFNETFLLKLCYHTYSCLFGTFLCDSFEQRSSEHIYDRTFSVWSYLNNQNNKMFVNYLYDETFQDILYPKYELAHLTLWTKLFCDREITHLVDKAHLQDSLLTTGKTSIDETNDEELKFVDASITGLSDYMYSKEISEMNERIKKFEQNLIITANANNNHEQQPVHHLHSILYDNPSKNPVARDTHHLNSISSVCSSPNDSNERSGKIVNSSGCHTCSNSSKNNNNKNKKSIHQLLDIDGLTAIEDNYHKRFVEREENYKKQIATLLIYTFMYLSIMKNTK